MKKCEASGNYFERDKVSNFMIISTVSTDIFSFLITHTLYDKVLILGSI